MSKIRRFIEGSKKRGDASENVDHSVIVPRHSGAIFHLPSDFRTKELLAEGEKNPVNLASPMESFLPIPSGSK